MDEKSGTDLPKKMEPPNRSIFDLFPHHPLTSTLPPSHPPPPPVNRATPKATRLSSRDHLAGARLVSPTAGGGARTPLEPLRHLGAAGLGRHGHRKRSRFGCRTDGSKDLQGHFAARGMGCSWLHLLKRQCYSIQVMERRGEACNRGMSLATPLSVPGCKAQVFLRLSVTAVFGILAQKSNHCYVWQVLRMFGMLE